MELNITWNDVPWTTYRTHFTGDQSDGTIPGWIIAHEGSTLEVVTPEGTVTAEVSGRLRYLSELGTGELPAVGADKLRAAPQNSVSSEGSRATYRGPDHLCKCRSCRDRHHGAGPRGEARG